MVVHRVKALSLVMEGGRYKVEVDRVSAGNWVQISGIDSNIVKTATIFDAKANQDGLSIFRPIDFGT